MRPIVLPAADPHPHPGFDIDRFYDVLHSFIVKGLHCVVVNCQISMKKGGRSVRRPPPVGVPLTLADWVKG